MKNSMIRTVDVVQYITPLREGGSLPAIVKASDEFMYVLKFRGAGQGKKVLVSELISGELARVMGLNVPELVFMNLDDSFRLTEPDEEIQDLLKFSVGLNFGMHYLSGAITYDPLVSIADDLSASLVVLLDSMVSNIDRTVKNTNLLNWKKELWVIDNGASFYFHHDWPNWRRHLERSFPMVKDHVLLERAKKLDQAAEIIQKQVTPEVIQHIVNLVPDDWLDHPKESMNPAEMRAAYAEFIISRLSKLNILVKEAKDAR
jgi:hypothetical protein